MKYPLRIAMRVAVAWGCSGLASPLAAQDAQGAKAQPGQSPPAEEKVVRLEEIVVTATKVETTVQSTPVAMSVLESEALRESGVYDVTELPDVAPAVEVERTSFGPVIGIRGVTTTDNTSKGDQGIGFNVDGINVGRPREQQMTFFDIDRVEVLRGPQGTLYGKSTTGGVLNFNTMRPHGDFEGAANLEFANFGTRRALAVLNGPVSDNLRLRLAVNQNVGQGWVETSLGDPNVVRNSADRNDIDDLAGRLSAVYFTGSTSLFVTSTAGRARGTGPGGVPYGIFSSESGRAQRQAFANPFQARRDEDFLNLTAQFVVKLGGVDLTYVGGYRDFDIDTIYSSTYDPIIAGTYEWIQYRGAAETKSQELRISGDAKRFGWVAGANWYREDLSESDHRWVAPIDNATLEGSVNGIDPLNSTDHESVGVFGQVNWLMTPSLKAVLGLRYSEDEVVRVGTFAPGRGPGLGWPDPDGKPCVAPADCVGFPNNHEQRGDKVTYRAGLDYKLNEDSMVYGYVATGYKAGGFNDFGPAGPAAGTDRYQPEDMIAYEVGFKGDLSPKLRYYTAAYFYDYRQAQIQSLTFLFGPPVLYTYSGAIAIKGWENEITWLPSDSDRIDLEFRLADSKYTDFAFAGTGSPGARGVSWNGLPIDRVPDVAGSITYHHRWKLPNSATLTGRVRSRYNGGYDLSIVSANYRVRQDGFTRTDLNLTYDSPRLSVGLFLRNAEDGLQLTSPPGPFGPGQANGEEVGVTTPRTFGLTMSVRF
jgi:iron complex outermembrane receptor protein